MTATMMNVPRPQRATKAKRKARLAFAGPPGSGKTWTALTAATSLPSDGKIVVIDTEKGSAADYADVFEFDHVPIDSYNPELLIAMTAAYAEDYAGGALVVDSMSHFWMGTDGMLEQVDKATVRMRASSAWNSGWKEMRPVERAMIEALLAFPGHVIVTMRTKVEWTTETDERTGKTKPVKIGTKPEQREGIEYEFTLVGDLDQQNTLVVSKSRMNSGAEMIRNGAVVAKPGPEFGKAVGEWLGAGVELPAVGDYVARANAARCRLDLRPLLAEVRSRSLAGAAVRDNGRVLSLAELIVEVGASLPESLEQQESEPAVEPATATQPESAPPPPAEEGGPEQAPTATPEPDAEPEPPAVQEPPSEPQGPFGEDRRSDAGRFAEEWLADLLATSTMGEMNRLVVRLQRAKGSLGEQLTTELMSQHGKRLREIRGAKQ